MKKLLFLAIYTVLFILLKYFGLFQPIELNLYDHYWQRSPIEAPDQRIVIVGIDEADLNKVNWPITNEDLANLILKIENQQPTVIGLDIFRDLGITDKLKQIFTESDKLIGVGMHEGVAFPETLKARERVGTVEVVSEPNFGELRRVYLYSLTDGSKDSQIPYLSLKLVWEYLKAQGNLDITGDEATGYLKVNGKVINKSDHTSGGYNLKGYGGYPYLVRWRKGDYSPEKREDRFKILTYTEAMAAPSDTFTDKIVIIGYRARSIKDQFITPLGWRYGVDIVAQTTSDLLSHIKDNRPIFKFIPEGIEYILLIIPIFIAYAQAYYSKLDRIWRSVGMQGAIALTLIALMYEGGYRLFSLGWWIPVAQSLVAYLISIGFFFAIKYIHGLQSANQRQQVKLDEQSKELKQLYEQRSIEEKQILLGQFASNLTHELNSQLGLLGIELDYLSQITENSEKITDYLYPIEDSEDQLWLLETIELDSLNNIKNSLKNQQNAIILLRDNLDDLRAVYQEASIKKQNFNVDTQLRKIIDPWRSRLSSAEIELKLDLNCPVTLNYPVPIFTQMIRHTLQNALEAIQVKKTEKGQIILKSQEESQGIKITITDNGIGMDSQTLLSASQIFYSTKPQGMGYGLYFIKQQLGDNLTIASQLQQGTTVILTFSQNPL